MSCTVCFELGVSSATKTKNKIRDLFKVKLYAIRSETKKKREREKHMLTLVLTGGS